MRSERRYEGRRDPRFVAVHRGGRLDDTTHRLLAAWAAACAERVLPLFVSRCPEDDRPAHAVAVAEAWSRHEASVGEAREAAIAAHASARATEDPVAREVARACGHAAATAHMADHELGAAYYALRAVRLSSRPAEADAACARERRAQHERLPEAIRALVLSDQELRRAKFKSAFEE
ncbi:MAG: hypothetical protein U0183_25825 [Polyangiaceae bacterium]